MRVLLLVATREFTERLRSKAFVISNLVVLVVILGSVLAPALFIDDDPTTSLGVIGDEAAAVGELAVGQAAAFDLDVEVVALDDRAAADQSLLDGEVDAVLLDAASAVVERSMGPRLSSLLASAANAHRLDAVLDEAGVAPEMRAQLFAVAPLQVEALEERDEAIDVFDPSILVVYAAVFLLYGLLVIYGQWVSQGIVEEKQSRVVEVLLASMRPSELLGGKILGLGALGLLQIVLFAGVGVGGLLATGVLDIPAASWGALALVVPWFVLGYLLYASLFAMAGALVSRVEDLQSVVMPVIIVLVFALFAAQFALAAPDSVVASVAGVVPFTAPIVQPILISAGMASWVEVAVSILLAAALIAVLIPLAGRVYRGGVLRTRGRVPLREALAAMRQRG